MTARDRSAHRPACAWTWSPVPPRQPLRPTVVPTVVVDPSCEPSARFVEDVTVPDDTLYNGGVSFRKTWRLRNDGECTWEPGVTWTYIGGELLGAQSPVEVELAEPGRIVDVSVDMVAPTSPGTYTAFGACSVRMASSLAIKPTCASLCPEHAGSAPAYGGAGSSPAPLHICNLFVTRVEGLCGMIGSLACPG